MRHPVYVGLAGFAFLGCAGGQTDALTPCAPDVVSDPIGPSETSDLGFSADEVAQVLGGARTITATINDTGDATVRSLQLTFTPGDNIRLETWTGLSGPQYEFCDVMRTETLVVDGLLEVEEVGGWFSGVGDGIVYAKSLDLAEVWVDGTFVVEAAEDLEQLARAQVNGTFACEPDEARVHFAAPSLGASAEEQPGALEWEAFAGSGQLVGLQYVQ